MSLPHDCGNPAGATVDSSKREAARESGQVNSRACGGYDPAVKSGALHTSLVEHLRQQVIRL